MTASDFRADRVGSALAGTNPTVRYTWKPDDIVGWPAALHHWTDRVSEEHRLGPQHDDLRAEIGAAIDEELALRG